MSGGDFSRAMSSPTSSTLTGQVVDCWQIENRISQSPAGDIYIATHTETGAKAVAKKTQDAASNNAVLEWEANVMQSDYLLSHDSAGQDVYIFAGRKVFENNSHG